MVGPTDQEMIVIKKRVCHSQFPKGAGASNHAGHIGEWQGWSGGRGSEENMWARAFIIVSM